MDDLIKTQIENRHRAFLINQENQVVFTRKILLFGDIDEMMARDVAEKAFLLDYISKEPISLIINSSGGDVYSGLLIIDLINALECPVSTIVIGKALSMAFIIAISGTVGFRYVTERATLMGHQISSSPGEGKLEEIKDDVIECERLDKIMTDTIMKKTKCPMAILKAIEKKDVFFTPKLAIKYGFADKIIKKI
jgi:ATP-dependent Clp protease protease subunit